MFTTDELKTFKAALPSKGVHLLHKRTGLSRPTIYKFLSGKSVRTSTEEMIWEAGLELIKETARRRDELRRKAKKVLGAKYSK